MRVLPLVLALLLCRPAWAGDCVEESTALTGQAVPCDGILVPFDRYGDAAAIESEYIETVAQLEVCVESAERLKRDVVRARHRASQVSLELSEARESRATWVVVALAVGVVLGSAGAFTVAAAVR